MPAATITIVPADASHTAAIVAIEREIPGPSIVALTNGLAVAEAIARGHGVVVALAGGEVAGWAWCSIEDGRGGEAAGQLSRIAVAAAHRRRGVGRALVAHVQALVAAHDGGSMRLSLDADDADAIAFFERLGYHATAVTMERRL